MDIDGFHLILRGTWRESLTFSFIYVVVGFSYQWVTTVSIGYAGSLADTDIDTVVARIFEWTLVSFFQSCFGMAFIYYLSLLLYGLTNHLYESDSAQKMGPWGWHPIHAAWNLSRPPPPMRMVF